MSERLAITGIRTYGRHGVLPLEQRHAQPLDIDVELDADVSRARDSDDLADTLDYAALHSTVVHLVRERSYRLLERLADTIASELMSDPRVQRVRVRIAKPALLSGATPSVTIESVRA